MPVGAGGNRAVATVLDQYTPVLRRAERLRFSTRADSSPSARHDALIRLCAAGDFPRAAALAFDTWHSLTTDDTED